jgi:hypothetical protein
MLKFLVPACFGLAMLCPGFASAQWCGCDDDLDCAKTRKKLGLIECSIDVMRLRRVSETDDCGCTRNRLALVSEPLAFRRLGLVDVPVDPCRPNLLDRMRDGMSSLSLRNRFSGDECCDECVDGAWGDEADYRYGTGRHSSGIYSDHDAESYYHDDVDYAYDEAAPMESMTREMAPRMGQPRQAMPREIIPREIIPRGVTPRNATPGRNGFDNYYVPQNNSSVIEPSTGEIEGSR